MFLQFTPSTSLSHLKVISRPTIKPNRIQNQGCCLLQMPVLRCHLADIHLCNPVLTARYGSDLCVMYLHHFLRASYHPPGPFFHLAGFFFQKVLSYFGRRRVSKAILPYIVQRCLVARAIVISLCGWKFTKFRIHKVPKL